ncbi:MAG: polysaccharide deacetylase family protein [Xanthomonadales bacterium]|nr:polysaccharide deacetylase family protein [Xanthomonadales bacterium]
MRTRLLPILLCSLGCVRAMAADCTSLDTLSWMAGHWEAQGGASSMTEQWTRVSPLTAEGVGEVRDADGVLKSRETLRLVSMSGSIYFVAMVSHNPRPIAFKLTECGERHARFENPDHDFPTLIAYRLTPEGEMAVEVSGADGQGFEIIYQAAPAPAARRIALTFDDAPRADSEHFTGAQRTRHLLASLASVDAPPAIFFSIGSRADEAGDVRLRQYQEAGHYIGNHSQTHQRITSLGVDGYIADIRAAHDALSSHERFVPLYRYPFLDEGRDAETRAQLRGALAALGYRNGYVTVDNYDWYMDAVFQRALEQGRDVDFGKLGEVYVSLLMDAVRFYDGIAADHLAQPPVHVLLLHENDLAAMYVDELVTALREEGWVVVDAMEAYSESAYLPEPGTLFTGQGRVAAIAEANGAARRELVHHSEDTAYLERAFEKSGAFLPPHPWQPEEGDLLYSSNHEGNSEIYLRPAGGEAVNLSAHPASDNYPAWSPDGLRIAFQSDRNGKLDIYLVNADGSGLRRLTEHPAHDYLPSWTPDGQQITFVSWRSEEGDTAESNHVYTMDADGSGQRRLVAESYGTSASVQWSPVADGTSVRTLKTSADGADLFLADAAGEVIRRLTDDGRFNGSPGFSPDGRRLAFYSQQGENAQIVVVDTEGGSRQVVVSRGLNWYPHYSPDGCWLVYTAQVRADDPHDLDIRAIRADGSGDWRVLVGGPGRQAEASWRPLESAPEVGCD